MAIITLRQANAVISTGATVKGSPLTNSEVDNNFSNINVEVNTVDSRITANVTALNTSITGNVGILSNLTTTAQTNLVSAVNEVKSSLDNLSQNEISNGTSNVRIGTSDGPIEVSANLLPLTSGIYDLGSNSNRFREIQTGNVVINGSLSIASNNRFFGTLLNTGVTSGTYGNTTLIPTFAVGTDGRITSASNVSIVAGATLEDDTTTNLDAFFLVMANSQTSGSFTTATISSTKLFFNANTGVLNATDYNSLSDIVLKTDLQQINNATGLLKQLNGFEFKWKDTSRKSAGVIAQEVEAILPHLVNKNSNGLKSVNYGSLTAYLIQCVKELTNRIEELEKKNGV